MVANPMGRGPRPRGPLPRRPSLARPCAWGLLVAAAWAGHPDPAAPAMAYRGPQSTELESLRRVNHTLRMELDLASAGRPYLVLDLAGGKVVLKSHGAVLREFPFRSAWARRLGFAALFRTGNQPLDTLWVGGRLLPPRRLERTVMVVDTVLPPDPSGTVTFIPPTPEEETPVPPSFRIRYGGGLSLVVCTGAEEAEILDGAALGVSSPLDRLMNWIRRRPWLRDHVRLHLTLPRGEAGSLYRAFSDGTPLLILGRWPGERDPG